MSTESVTLFFALLAVVAQVAVAASLVLWVGGLVSPAVARWRDAAFDAVGPSALTLAFCVAAVCTAGSLYLSEVAGFPPCRLCWYQRYAMYPLVPVLGLAAWARRTGVWLPGLLVAVAGGAISTWHVLVERYPSLETGACDPTNPCSLRWVERFGYLTIPTMALSGFALIATLLLIARREHRALPD